MLFSRVGRVVVAALVLGLGCSVNAIEGDPTPRTPTNCLARCQKIVTACGRTSSNCDATCTQVNEAQLSCVERAACDDQQTSYCVTLPDSDTDDPNQTPDEDDNSPTALCQRRCLALAAQCTGSSFQCASLCAHATPNQLTCLEQTGCDPAAIELCVEGPGSPGGGGSGGAGAAGVAGTAGTGGSGSGGAGGGTAGTSAQAGMSGGSGQPDYSTCELLTCNSTKGSATKCENRPCMSTSTGFGRCYPVAKDGVCAEGKAVSAEVNKQTQTLCVPANCPDPGTYEL